ncbi:MmpS family transport accessory protein [Lysobacter korlensis]|uniref:MmpS family transport accessory protein n=1 Tax=Lysobacter korlensis TaxID=553636 RepID=A0ABV6RXM3_9GAMM
MSDAQQPVTYAAPAPAPAPIKKANGLGIASLVLGILALAGSFIPFINYGSGFLAFLGLIFGVIGLFIKYRARGMAVAGTIISAIALILSIFLSIAYTAGFVNSMNENMAEEEAAANREITVVYEVEGAAQDASIYYVSADDEGSEQVTGHALPFTKEYTVKAGGEWDWSFYSLNASNGIDDTGEITCRITIDGEVVSENTSTGEFASASCDSSGFGGDE